MKFLILILACLLFSCNQAAKKQPVAIVGNTISPANRQSTLLTQTRVHRFSDVAKPDTFKLVVRGVNLIDAKVTFEIINYQGHKIYSEEFSALEIMGEIDDSSPKLTVPQQEATIKKCIKEFFAETNFTNDMRKLKESDFSEPDILKDMKDERGAVGFSYTIGYEDSKSIAYSKKQRKVVTYFSCC